MKNKYFIWIIAGILILIAAFFRLYRFETFMTFLGDQGRDAVIVKRIVTFEHFPAIGAPSSVGQIYLGPFYYYLIAPFLLIFNFNPVGLGYGVALMSIAGIIGSYIIARKYFNEIVALTFLCLMTFSYTLIELARFSWNPNLLPIFTFLTLYFLYEWLQKRKKLFAILFGSFFALAIQLHYLALIMMGTVIVYFLYEYIHANSKHKKILLFQILYALGAFIFFLTPLIIFDIRHPFQNSKNFIALFTEGKIAAESSYIDRFLVTIESFFRHALQVSTPTWAALILFLLFIIGATSISIRTKSRFLMLNILNVIVFIFGFAALDSLRHYHYFGPAYLSFYLMISAIPLIFDKKILQYAVFGIFLGGFLLLNAPKYHYFEYKTGSQIEHAQIVAESYKKYIKKEPIQMVPLPTTETDGHYRYYLELYGYNVMPNDSAEQAEELYVICFSTCKALDDPQWQIAAFYDKQIAAFWHVEHVTIYKLIHGKKP